MFKTNVEFSPANLMSVDFSPVTVSFESVTFVPSAISIFPIASKFNEPLAISKSAVFVTFPIILTASESIFPPSVIVVCSKVILSLVASFVISAIVTSPATTSSPSVRMALCQIVLVEKTNKFSSNSSGFRWSYFVANKLLLIKILALK